MADVDPIGPSERDGEPGQTFDREMIELFNHSILGLLVSIGHRTRRFDTMASMPPASSDEIAQAAGLGERYVREWLAAMVTGRIVGYEQQPPRYWLPPRPRCSADSRRRL